MTSSAIRISSLAFVESLLVSCGRRGVTPKLAFGVARLIEGSIDDLLAGRLLPKACPHCGRHADEDFADEETVFEDRPREAVLQLVK
jgi:hypothetical protein